MSSSSKLVVISGGSRGLGQALVTQCLERGYAVATFSRSSTEFIKTLAEQDANSQRFFWRPVDASDPAALKDFVSEAYLKFGRIDGVINNAGLGADGILATMRTTQIAECISLNLSAAIYLSQACSKVMLQQGSGSIINISSVNAVRGHSGVSVYSATKAGLDGMTRSLARELGPRGIRVNSIAPGYFESDMVGHLTEEATKRIIRRTPLGRLGNTRDIASVAMFLLSTEANFITGQTIVVDGGITC
ncbi:MAG: SDR family NAD(P)-dependent oxidoreductase [Myxococcota bacterium]